MFRLAIVLICGLAVGSADASGIWLAGGAKGGDGSMTIGIHGQRWGLNIGVLNNADYSDDEVLDYPVPHNDYTSLGEQRVGNLYSLDVAYRVLKGEIHGLVLAGGLSTYEESELARSNVTGWIYTQDENNVIEPDAGLFYTLRAGRHVSLLVGAHTQLGVQGGLSLRF